MAVVSGPRTGRVRIGGSVVAVRLADGRVVTESDAVDVDLSAAQVLMPVTPRTVMGVMFAVRRGLPMDDPTIPESIRALMRMPDTRLFFKPPATFVDPGEPIVVRPDAGTVVAEGEVALVISRTCTRVAPEEAWRHVAGITIVNDVTGVDFILRDGDFVRGKAQSTFCPIGPWVLHDVSESVITDGIAVSARLNGEIVGQGTTAVLSLAPSAALSHASHCTTLEPGDLLHLGTIAGAPITPGDVVAIEVDGIGVLENPVIAAPATN
jgi:2-keto-4-pentenoate hydratase/2-oxohepta-3-ene-1,7-dioic acid hydratase in catechol pathway